MTVLEFLQSHTAEEIAKAIVQGEGKVSRNFANGFDYEFFGWDGWSDENLEKNVVGWLNHEMEQK